MTSDQVGLHGIAETEAAPSATVVEVSARELDDRIERAMLRLEACQPEVAQELRNCLWLRDAVSL